MKKIIFFINLIILFFFINFSQAKILDNYFYITNKFKIKLSEGNWFEVRDSIGDVGFGIEQRQRNISSYDVLMGETTVGRAEVTTIVPGLTIIPSNVDLTGAELELINIPRRAYRLREALEGVKEKFDYVLIDSPPSLNLLTLNALVAARSVIVPLQCEFFALEGLSMLIKTINRVQNSYNPELAILGVVLTMYDKRNSLSDQVAQDVRDFLGDKVYKTIIPRNVRVSEAPSHGKPALLYDHKCAGSLAYMQLASEMLQRERLDIIA